jgi:hypothetical protein
MEGVLGFECGCPNPAATFEALDSVEKPLSPDESQGGRGGERESGDLAVAPPSDMRNTRGDAIRCGSLSRRAQGVSGQREIPAKNGAREPGRRSGPKLPRRKTVVLASGIGSANCATQFRESTSYDDATRLPQAACAGLASIE